MRPMYSREERDKAIDHIAAEIVGACPHWDDGEYEVPRGGIALAARGVGCEWITAKRWWDKLSEEERVERLRHAAHARERARAIAASILPGLIQRLGELGKTSADPREVAVAVKAVASVVDGDRPPDVALAGVTMLTGDQQRGEGKDGPPDAPPAPPTIEVPDIDTTRDLH